MGQHQALSARVHQQNMKMNGVFIKHEETTLVKNCSDAAIIDAASDPVHGIW